MQTTVALPKDAAMVSLDVAERLDKLELHAHLNGSVRLSTLQELAPQLDIAEDVKARSNGEYHSCI
jgi:adenosine deaminase